MAKVKQSVKQKSRKTKKASVKGGGSKGIRIPVYALKGRCPRPLDDGADCNVGFSPDKTRV